MKRTRTSVPGALFVSLLVVAGCSNAASPTEPAAAAASGATALTAGATLNRQLAEVRAVTAGYHNIEKAIADGFAPISPCVESPAGGMGIHYGNQSRIDDPAINYLEPEVLLYAPDKHGRLRLVAVEYIVPEPIWPGGAADPPSLFGLDFHAGPPPLLILHAWIWLNNPSGMFEDFNPNVSCAG
jgi:hypothetical protein